MNLASSARWMERPEHSSRHSLVPASCFPAGFFDLNRFSATAMVSRPGRSPASSVSFTRRSVLGVALADVFCGDTCAECPGVTSSRLTHSQYFIQPRFKIFFSLGPQANLLNRNSLLRRAHPGHQFLDILPRFFMIFAQILRL